LSLHRKTLKMAALLICAALSVPTAVAARVAPAPCDGEQLRRLPVRSTTSPSGSEFARRVAAASETERDHDIETALLAGNLPRFLRQLVPVTMTGSRDDGTAVRITVCVAPDYLAVGSDRDFLLVPMRLATALRVARRYGATLPTGKIVDAIYEQSAVHLLPQPLPAGDQMRSTDYYRHHNQLIADQRRRLGGLPGVLIAGHKKDLVLTNRLWRQRDRVAIYGWHREDHSPIQPLSMVHGERYADYSHGVRLVGTVVYVDGKAKSIFEVLADRQLAPVLTDEGELPRATELVASLAAREVAADTAVASVPSSLLTGAIGTAR
jgi:hypothetical protein